MQLQSNLFPLGNGPNQWQRERNLIILAAVCTCAPSCGNSPSPLPPFLYVYISPPNWEENEIFKFYFHLFSPKRPKMIKKKKMQKKRKALKGLVLWQEVEGSNLCISSGKECLSTCFCTLKLMRAVFLHSFETFSLGNARRR